MQQYEWANLLLGVALAFAGAQLPGAAGIAASFAGLVFSVFAAWKKPGMSNLVGVILSVMGLFPALAIASAIFTWMQAIAGLKR